MFRLSWHVLLCAASLAALSSAGRTWAKPPDLPVKTDNTLTPDVLPDSEWEDPRPLPEGVHGSIEIGIGFGLNGVPTCKFLVTEFWGFGNCRKDDTFKGCVETLLRVLKRDAATESPQEPMHCPWYREQRCQEPCEGNVLLAPSVLENLQKLVRAQEAREQGRRCIDDSQNDLEIHLVWPDATSPLCGPGVSVMVDGLTKGCYLSLAVGRWGHAVDLARQAYALDPERVEADPVLSKLHTLVATPPGCCQEKKCPGDCCDKCPDCPNCPCCPKATVITLKPLKLIILGRPTIKPDLPAVEPQIIQASDRVLGGIEGEEQEAPVYQKAIAKPYRETNDAPPAVGKGD
jgi:hypothetical protein